ncbi:MAG: hypothetical protein VR70_15670 [Rhodospirillaceae bacterium BRH_c57]|nr:MAG: hypothetical protein VR70_15670 [Rhodospirillaceae bacterium BRH_c57]
MTIAHVSTYDVSGGAALAAYRLHRGLREIGAPSTMVVRLKQSEDPTVVVPLADQAEDAAHAADVAAAFRTDSAGLSMFSRGGFIPFHTERATFGKALARNLNDYDVVNLHWVRGALDWPAFFPTRPAGQVVVWTLQDMHPFTGGCHYGLGCRRFAATCGACPILESQQAEDLSTIVQRRKTSVLQHFTGRALHIVSTSRWLADEAASSTVFQGLPMSVIPAALDTTVFAPAERAAARRRLGLTDDAFVLFFVAQDITDPRKGLDILDAALARLNPPGEVMVLLAGDGTYDAVSGVPFQALGPVSAAADLAALYCLADLTVVPSRQDNLPNTVLESLACGTPVLGSTAGGIPDMITDGENGMLAPVGDVDAWTAALDRALASPEALAAMGQRGRSRAVREHALEVQARRYASLYESLL